MYATLGSPLSLALQPGVGTAMRAQDPHPLVRLFVLVGGLGRTVMNKPCSNILANRDTGNADSFVPSGIGSLPMEGGHRRVGGLCEGQPCSLTGQARLAFCW